MEELTLNEKKYSFILDKPEEESKATVLLIPGVSGKPFSNRYDYLKEKCNENKYALFRYESWANVEDLETKSIADLHDELNDAISYLKTQGFEQIGRVGKSFGGGLALTYRNPAVHAMVLWAPAIGYAEKSNIGNWWGKELKYVDKLTDIKLSKSFLESLDVPVHIIHGTADPVIPLKIHKR